LAPASWLGDVYPLFTASCDGCHGVWGDDPDALYATMTTWDAPGYGYLVVPGDRSTSALYLKFLPDVGGLPGSRMPLQVPPMSVDEVAAIAAWIEQGAANDATFESAVVEPFERYRCKMCHMDMWGTGRNTLHQNLLDREVAGWRFVTPGDPAQSLLYRKVDGTTPPFGVTMPINYPHPDDDMIERIGLWIDAGAPTTDPPTR
jgi:hypothetical protein